jgi:hypothetical protein
MKGFFIEITNNLLEPKHRKAMKESVWLFMWLLDKMTSITEEGIGKVLGGKPIKFEEVKKDLGISIRTYRRWTNQLKKAGYVNLLRTPYGCVITVNKAKKRFGRSVISDTTRYAKNGTSLGGNGTSNKTIQLDNNKRDNTVIIKSLNDGRTRLKNHFDWKL